jgi:hypothetical protein
VPWIVDYARVLQQMADQGFKSLYYNSGAFGFEAGVLTESVGWIGGDDPSLRPEARALARKVPAPIERELTSRVLRAIREMFPGNVWVMPKSNWAYELDFGSRDWLPALLEHAGVDSGLLQTRTNASAIEFGRHEGESLAHLVEGLLRMLLGSDFALAFPGRPVVCTLHHHKQVWWTSTDPGLIQSLRQLADGSLV